MNSHSSYRYEPPFGVPALPQQPLPKNYADEFVAADYEHKDSVELESYARNLRNKLLEYLSQKPFPAFLFEKLEKRLDGLTSILQKRSVVRSVLSAEQATKRLSILSARLDPAVPATSRSMGADGPQLKKRKFGYLDDVNKSRKEQQDQPNFAFNEEEEEEEITPPSFVKKGGTE